MRTLQEIEAEISAKRLDLQGLLQEHARATAAAAEERHEQFQRFLAGLLCSHGSRTRFVGCGGRAYWICDACEQVVEPAEREPAPAPNVKAVNIASPESIAALLDTQGGRDAVLAVLLRNPATGGRTLADCVAKFDNAAPQFGPDPSVHQLGRDPAADAELAREFRLPGAETRGETFQREFKESAADWPRPAKRVWAPGLRPARMSDLPALAGEDIAAGAALVIDPDTRLLYGEPDYGAEILKAPGPVLIREGGATKGLTVSIGIPLRIEPVP